jgi:tyrosyl-tRNA synthetase
MSISDELMWRYYLLLTDVLTAEIECMKQDVAAGRAHPMKLKKNLAHRIVTDFHSKQEADRAAEAWAKQFQRDEVPENIEEVAVPYAEIAVKSADSPAIKLDKLLVKCGLAESASDGMRKVKQKSVRIDGEVKTEPILQINIPVEFTVRVGRMLKKVSIS